MAPNIIHPTAIVSADAKLGSGVKIGPFCIVEGGITLGDDVELISHVSLSGSTTIGSRTRVFPFASIGHTPQDLKYEGEDSRVVIGEDCSIRENVTINPGTSGGRMETTIGNNCLLMASSHVAHDCILGNNVIVANYGGIAGHCEIGDFVTVGGIVVIHQYVRVGAHAFIGAQSMIDGDVIPYGMAVGNRARLAGLNLVGLKRRGFNRNSIHTLRAAYRTIFSTEGTLSERVDGAAIRFKDEQMVQNVVQFISTSSDRSLTVPKTSESGD